jgi:hypothetical protein
MHRKASRFNHCGQFTITPENAHISIDLRLFFKGVKTSQFVTHLQPLGGFACFVAIDKNDAIEDFTLPGRPTEEGKLSGQIFVKASPHGLLIDRQTKAPCFFTPTGFFHGSKHPNLNL